MTQLTLQKNLDSAAEVISAISCAPASIPPGRGDAEWIAAIKSRLINIGRNRGYSVCAAGFPDECEREWLYDLVWYRNEPQQHLHEIALVMESEWSRDPFQIKYDFEKLLIAKSPIKVMVFQDFRGNLPQLWLMLETAIHCFKAEPAHEKYILGAYQNDENAFSIRTIVA